MFRADTKKLDNDILSTFEMFHKQPLLKKKSILEICQTRVGGRVVAGAIDLLY